MKKYLISLAALFALVIMIFSVNVFAEEVAYSEPYVTDAPVTEVQSEPVATTETYYEPTYPGYVEPNTEAFTEPYEEPVYTRPTEYYEYDPPSTESEYYATNSLIDAGEYKGEAEKWNNIDENDIIALSGDDADGAISFKDMKNNGNGDENEYLFLILGIVLVVIAAVGVGVFIYTFVPEKKPQRAKAASASEGRSEVPKKKNTTTVRSTGEHTRRRHDDYNDGF